MPSNNLIDPTRCYANVLSQPILTKSQRIQKLLQENFPWVNRRYGFFGHCYVSVVVCDLNVEGVARSPPEAETPLIVDTNAVLPRSIATEFFQSVSRCHTKVVQGVRRIEYQ